MNTIIETIAANPSLTKLVSSLEKAGLSDTLKGAGPYTLFAPTNESFTRMDIEAMLNDAKELSETRRLPTMLQRENILRKQSVPWKRSVPRMGNL